MKNIYSFDELNLPFTYRGYLKHFLSNIARVESVSKIILFGSCARGQINETSDIDLLVITNGEIASEDEFYIMNDCPPSYESEYYIPSDIIVNSQRCYNEFKNSFGMLQRQVQREGLDLSGLL